MGSSRLPGKVMMPLAGEPLFLRIGERMAQVSGLSGVILATTTDPRNDAMAALAADHGMVVARWAAEDDIAGRLKLALDLSGAEALLKINADCPLADPAIMQLVLDAYLAGPDPDVASNKVEPSYPLGYSVELISARALRWCERNLREAEDRELVIKWILDRPERFPAVSVRCESDHSHLNLTVDTPEDYALMAEIYSALHGHDPLFGMEPVLRYLAERDPKIDGC
tara:strand:+ start:443 stop:1120 length:678 start_codon:yes stop_codon:yes gene_type:complete